jgi:hypothetical protein
VSDAMRRDSADVRRGGDAVSDTAGVSCIGGWRKPTDGGLATGGAHHKGVCVPSSV